jgi:hypothetical protein
MLSMNNVQETEKHFFPNPSRIKKQETHTKQAKEQVNTSTCNFSCKVVRTKTHGPK